MTVPVSSISTDHARVSSVSRFSNQRRSVHSVHLLLAYLVNDTPSARSTIDSALNKDITDSCVFPMFTASYAELRQDSMYEHAPTFTQLIDTAHVASIFIECLEIT